MNAPHWHLLLNHVPVLGTGVGLGLLAFALWRHSAELKQAAFGVFVLVALLAVPVYLTGEPSEGGIASLPGVSKPLIETHEGVANFAFVGVLVVSGLMAWTANLGGQVRHTEIRSGASGAASDRD